MCKVYLLIMGLKVLVVGTSIDGYRLVRIFVIQKLISSPPIVTFKRPPSLHNILVHLKLSDSKRIQEEKPTTKGSYTCGSTRCSTCGIYLPATHFNSKVTKLEYKISGYYNCKTNNLIYQLQCKSCDAEYIGLTTGSLRQRMNNHCFDTNHKDPDKPVPIYAGTHNQDFQTCYTTKILRVFPKQCNSSQLRQFVDLRLSVYRAFYFLRRLARPVLDIPSSFTRAWDQHEKTDPSGIIQGQSGVQNQNRNFKASKRLYKCNYCKKLGHKAADCWTKMANEKQVSMASEQTHAAAEEIVTLTSSSVSTLCAKLTRRDDVWCVDSGATTHMCRDKNSFLELTPTISQKARSYKFAKFQVSSSSGSGSAVWLYRISMETAGMPMPGYHYIAPNHIVKAPIH
uniref:Uncharacterized protein n=1 Tax=Timema shepardi TaxID=629360 RepID=A0A7R9FYD0_TIMSH|nr:unnamed protein product [Timema shepardi]